MESLAYKKETGSGEAPSRADVWKMFDRIAPRYDLLNRLLSFGRDVAWRKAVSGHLPELTGQRVLDLATGTADLAISLCNTGKKVREICGMDMSGEMLKIGLRKISQINDNKPLSLINADAMVIPFTNNSFHVVTIAFGIRNVLNVKSALKEMLRILKRNGRAVILEFSLPENIIIRTVYLCYFRWILPLVGSLISGDGYSYRYLNKTVETFPYGDSFCSLMEESGFKNVRAFPQTFGVATIYRGEKL